MLQRSTSYANPELPTYLASLLRNLPDDGVDATLRLLECILVGGTASFETFLATRANLYGQASRSKCEE
ncbi:hypothetical protein SPRG_10643, partial [Saprolegnia parasitica CBS 223.65]